MTVTVTVMEQNQNTFDCSEPDVVEHGTELYLIDEYDLVLSCLLTK